MEILLEHVPAVLTLTQELLQLVRVGVSTLHTSTVVVLVLHIVS